MPHDLTPLRLAQLFELLRQQNLSQHTSDRLRARGYARALLDNQEASEVRILAANSWT